MKNEIEIKQQVLDMLKDLMMGTSGDRVKPKMVTVDVVSAKPVGKEGLEDVLKKASEENPVDEEEMDPAEMEDDSDEDDEEPKMSLKEFLKRG